ncbi:hypothetical protein AO726_04790 [Pseudomonas sp. TTU2014-080ASC]|nr:hypothetical protein AO726_04790 [Pseudomonas sp. TTU2014-080ASC]
MAVGVYGNHIKSAWVLRPAAFLLQKVLSGSAKFLTFPGVYALYCSAPCSMASIANFYEYYCIGVKHDQIELPEAAAPVLGNQAEAVLLQVLPGQCLGSRATSLRAYRGH